MKEIKGIIEKTYEELFTLSSKPKPKRNLKTIDALTKEQEALIDVYVKNALDVGYNTSPLDRKKAEDAVIAIAKLAELPTPKKFVFFDSPMQCQEYAAKIRNNGVKYDGDYYCSWYWSGYYNLYYYIRNELFPETIDDYPELDIILKIMQDVHYVQRVDDTYILSERPKHIRVNNRGLHCTFAPALEYRDGDGVYSLNGIQVAKEIVLTPADQLDPMLLVKQTNVEIRREIWRKIGSKNIMKKLKGELLDEKNVKLKGSRVQDAFGTNEKTYTYKLYSINLGNGNIHPFLYMINPSTGDEHFESVEANCKTVDDALKSRNGESYFPAILT